MGKPYSGELDSFASTFRWVASQNVGSLRNFLNRWSGEHVAVVGSGGSFSAAFVIALFRELVHHSPTTAVTPLEFDALLRRLAPRALLLSAEGKNRDILAAAQAAQTADLASAAITLTTSNLLVSYAHHHAALRVFGYQMDWEKDGYLATNSLLALVLLAYRVLFGDTEFHANLAQFFAPEHLAQRRRLFHEFDALSLAGERGLLVLYTAQSKAFAVDLESKITEAALGSVQIADLRQFAHGRHLQLASASAPAVLLVSSAQEAALAQATANLLPAHVHHWMLTNPGAREQDVAIAGLLDAMFLVEALGVVAGVDPGQPTVPEFGRLIHAVDSATVLRSGREEQPRLQVAARRKLASHKPPSQSVREDVVAAAARYAERLQRAEIQAAVFDFDGTLCRAENRYETMATEHAEQLSALIRQGLHVAIATGRGGSLHDGLRQIFDPELHSSILVGYYSGALIASLDEDFNQPAPNPQFQAVLEWLGKSVYSQHAKPIADVVRGGHMSIRLDSAQECQRLLGALRHWLDRYGFKGWRAFSSGHSIDVLDASTSKRRVVEHLAVSLGIDPSASILRLGDSGQEGGNDYELLSDGLSLSCERVSVDLDSCWNFGAPGSNQVDVTSAYLRGLVRHGRSFRLLPAALFGA